jgi:hypothetical protein
MGNRTVRRRSLKEFSQLAVPALSSDDQCVQNLSLKATYRRATTHKSHISFDLLVKSCAG